MADAAADGAAPATDAPDQPGDVDPALFARLADDPLAIHLGIELEQVRPGYARAAMTVAPGLLNAFGMAHGGATMALLDVVHAAVSNSHGTLATAQDGRLVATALARVFRTGRPWDATEGPA